MSFTYDFRHPWASGRRLVHEAIRRFHETSHEVQQTVNSSPLVRKIVNSYRKSGRDLNDVYPVRKLSPQERKDYMAEPKVPVLTIQLDRYGDFQPVVRYVMAKRLAEAEIFPEPLPESIVEAVQELGRDFSPCVIVLRNDVFYHVEKPESLMCLSPTNALGQIELARETLRPRLVRSQPPCEERQEL